MEPYKWMMPRPQPPNGNRLRWSHSEEDLALQAIIWLRLDDHQLWSAPKSCILSNFNHGLPFNHGQKKYDLLTKAWKTWISAPFPSCICRPPQRWNFCSQGIDAKWSQGLWNATCFTNFTQDQSLCKAQILLASLQDWKTPSKNILQHSTL